MAKRTDASTSDQVEMLDRFDPRNIARNEALANRVERAHSVMTAALADLLEAVAEADAHESYWAEGSQTVWEWLVAHIGVHGKTARTWSRMAKQLADYPEFRRMMADGVLGFDKLRQLLKYVDPDDEAEIADAAVHESAEDLEAHARALRRVSRERVKEIRSERWFEDFFDHDEMKYSFKGEIPGQDGLIVHKAIQLLGWKTPEAAGHDTPRDPYQCAADALVEMASNALADQSSHDIATVVVHANAANLHLDDAVGAAEFGTDVPIEAIRRMTCDGRLQLVAHADDGSVLGVGRVTRSIPPWLRRLIRERDKGCRFPGCRRTYWTQIHHIVHWAHGGPTDIDNLITLCGFHHRMLHEDGWTVAGDPNGEVLWLRPGGRPFRRKAGPRRWEESREPLVDDMCEWAAENVDLVRPVPG